MRKIFLLLCVLFCCSVTASFSQIYGDWMEYVENMRAETEDEETLETLYNDLSHLSTHPLDINEITEEQLRLLPFLTGEQIDELAGYRRRYGEMSSLYELKALRTFDVQTIRLILPFVYVATHEKPGAKLVPRNLLRYGKNELFFRYDRNLNRKKGYGTIPDSVMAASMNKKYLGEPFYHSIRYSYTFADRLQAGIVAEKDAGEPFFRKDHRGYDFYSAHFFYKGNKVLRRVALGDYKASFGQGLLMSMDFTPGRYAIITQGERRSNGFKKHHSTNETDFLRGAAVALRIRSLDASVFYSYRKLDAKTDSFDILSFKRDGLHRLPREVDKKRVVTVYTGGMNLRFTAPSIRIGMTGVYYGYGRYSAAPKNTPHNRFAFRGNSNWGVAVDYLIRRKGVKFYGETAMSKNGALATVNTIRLSPASFVNAVLLYRNYAKDYHSFYARSFGQRASIQGEEGVYMALEIRPLAYWKISTYADLFRYSWLNYGVNAPSSGREYMVQADHEVSRSLAVVMQYRFRQKETNHTEQESTRIRSYKQHKIRLQCSYILNSQWYMKTTVDGNQYIGTSEAPRQGWMLSQNIGWKKEESPVQADMYAAWFQTDDHSTRMYSYEKNLLYSFSSSSFQGQGVRLALNLRWYITSRLTASAKVGWVCYSDRDIIGTDLEEIEGSSKTDIFMNIRWVF